MTRMFGVGEEFGEDAILGKLEGMKDVIEQVNKQFKDPGRSLRFPTRGAEVTGPKNFYKTEGSKTYIPKNFYMKTTYSSLLSEKFGGSAAPPAP
ncbi:putative arsenical pump ATPase, ArsA/GET3 [Helianthus anomalus]